MSEWQERNGVSAQSIQRWQRPGREWMKVNSDGAFTEERCEGGWSAVIRDADGEFILAEVGRLQHALDALQAEAYACLAGVMMAIDQGIGRVIFETDSLILKQALENPTHRLSSSGGLICELQCLISSSFISYAINFVPRSCNRVAHALAALGCKCPHGDKLQWESTLTDVEDLVASDIAESLS
ncbi:hypothetical protein C2845_PM05G17690 [Panicum miliaceum]|uniref:RNase H type-1 domain-containing protein n=1 Tax=Panicum miliaceum TaxID=4540 RepID=A0A3L6SVV6_PANMI|nr:hypothetical protein C2845_PM05G17690 [Panicum miliaceum]